MRWSMLPVSVAAHAAAVVTILIIPLAADIEMPAPWPFAHANKYVAAEAVAPQVPVERARPQVTQSITVPLSAPDRIIPAPRVPEGIQVDGALPDVAFGTNVGPPDMPRIPLPPPPPPPPAPPRPTLVRPGGVIREPKKIVDVPAVYPEFARLAKVEGRVVIEAIIDERGMVMDTRILQSHAMLDAAALAALKQWRYTPTLLNGMPVRVLMTITFNFTLGDRIP
jgi:protein TonB